MATLMIGMGGGGGRNKGAPSMPPPEGPSKMSKDPMAAKKPGEPDEAEGDKATPDRAIVIKADAHCINCQNYDPQSGSCEEVEGVFEPEDACHAFYEPMGGPEEPDADQMGGAPDADTDDAGMLK